MLGVVLVDQLREPQSTRHARGAAADDNHVGRHLRAVNAFERFAEDQHKDKLGHGFTRIFTDCLMKRSAFICVNLRR